MPQLSLDGQALTGIGSIAIGIDGATPAALVGYEGGSWGWLSNSLPTGPAVPPSGGPHRIYQYYVPGSSVTQIDPNGANTFYAGGGTWAAWLAGAGVRTNIMALAAGLPDAGLLDVSHDGELVTVDSYQQGRGLTVYDPDGLPILALPQVLLTRTPARLADGVLAYGDTTGWHLVQTSTQRPPRWFPRLDDPYWMTLCAGTGDRLVLIEGTQGQLSVRFADRPQGYVIATGDAFSPDAVLIAPDTVRVAYATTQGEAASTLVVVDVNVRTGAQQIGTVVAGALVFTAGPDLPITTFAVGPAEGGSLVTTGITPPVFDPVTDPRAGGRMQLSWQAWARSLSRTVSSTAAYAQAIPRGGTSARGFGTIGVADGSTLQATGPNDTLTLTSVNGSILITLDQTTKTIDLSIGAGYWTPITNGDPLSPEILFDSEGDCVVGWVPAP